MLEILVIGIIVMLFIWLGTTVDITPVLMGIVWLIFLVGWINVFFGDLETQSEGFAMMVMSAPILLARLFYLRHREKEKQKIHGGGVK